MNMYDELRNAMVYYRELAYKWIFLALASLTFNVFLICILVFGKKY